MSNTPRTDHFTARYDATRNLLDRANIGAEAIVALDVAERQLTALREELERLKEENKLRLSTIITSVSECADLRDELERFKSAEMPEEPTREQIHGGIYLAAQYYDALRSLLAQREERIRELEKDAERYRWLRSFEALWSVCFAEPVEIRSGMAWARLGSRWIRDHLDAAIDAARRKEGK